MPTLSEDEIKALIADGAIGAIAFDTTVIEPNRNLRSSIIRSLGQFQNRPEKVLVPEVIRGEMHKHITEAAESTQRALRKARRAHDRRWHRHGPEGEDRSLLLDREPTEFAKSEIEGFCQDVGAEILQVPPDGGFAQNILSAYLSARPPFGESEKRKHEFPDAFALFSLEHFATENDCYVICISSDKGWKDFGEASERLIVVDNIANTLGLFHDHLRASEIVQKWRDSVGGDHLDAIASAFRDHLDGAPFEVDASVDGFYEVDPYDVHLEFVDPHGISEPKVLSVTEDTVTFSVTVEVCIRFEVEFKFYAYDHVDSEEILINSESLDQEQTEHVQLIITAERELADEPVFEEVEVVPWQLVARFGHVDVYPDENPEHERY
ncbi:PIN domain-containing protein [Maricaulis sp.]|uniref:PIN domain-containing protein n=1 Tax=Maricaulis sp. TaxID=1486257 RepID=UPI003A8E0921